MLENLRADLERKGGLWYNGRSITMFQIEAIELRPEMSANGRPSPKEAKIGTGSITMFQIAAIELRPEMSANGRPSPKEARLGTGSVATFDIVSI